jgi:hypothetical protein
MIQNETHALEIDQTIGELVLDRLEFSDRLPELASLLGVVHGQIERTPGGAVGPSQQHHPCSQKEIIQADRSKFNERDRHRIQPQLPVPPGAHRARRHATDAGNTQVDQSEPRRIDGHKQMRGTPRGFDETKRSCDLPRVDLDRARARIRIRIRIERAERERDRGRAGVQSLQQVRRRAARRSRERKIGERGRPHRRRTAGTAELRHRHHDLAKTTLVRIGAQSGDALPDQLAPYRRDRFGRCRVLQADRAPMRIEKPTQGFPQHRRDILVRDFARPHHGSYA